MFIEGNKRCKKVVHNCNVKFRDGNMVDSNMRPVAVCINQQVLILQMAPITSWLSPFLSTLILIKGVVSLKLIWRQVKRLRCLIISKLVLQILEVHWWFLDLIQVSWWGKMCPRRRASSSASMWSTSAAESVLELRCSVAAARPTLARPISLLPCPQLWETKTEDNSKEIGMLLIFLLQNAIVF